MPFTPGRPVLDAKAHLFKAMAHPARVRVLELLADRDRTVGELAEETGLELSNLSQQLAVLRRSGLIDGRRIKSHVLYTLTDPKIVRLLDVARELLLTHLDTTQQLRGALDLVDEEISEVVRRD